MVFSQRLTTLNKIRETQRKTIETIEQLNNELTKKDELVKLKETTLHEQKKHLE